MNVIWYKRFFSCCYRTKAVYRQSVCPFNSQTTPELYTLWWMLSMRCSKPSSYEHDELIYLHHPMVHSIAMQIGMLNLCTNTVFLNPNCCGNFAVSSGAICWDSCCSGANFSSLLAAPLCLSCCYLRGLNFTSVVYTNIYVLVSTNRSWNRGLLAVIRILSGSSCFVNVRVDLVSGVWNISGVIFANYWYSCTSATTVLTDVTWHCRAHFQEPCSSLGSRDSFALPQRAIY